MMMCEDSMKSAGSFVGMNNSSLKRGRSNSISGRLRAASDLEECGVVSKFEKGMLKDYIISGDSELEAAIEKYESKGDTAALRAFIDQNNNNASMELLDGIELNFLNMYSKNGRGSRGESFDLDFNVGIIEDEDIEELSAAIRASSNASRPLSTVQKSIPQTTAPLKMTAKQEPTETLSITKKSIIESTVPTLPHKNPTNENLPEPSNRRGSFDFVDQELINFRRAYRTSSGSIGSFSGFNALFDQDFMGSDFPIHSRKESFSFPDLCVGSTGHGLDFDEIAKINAMNYQPSRSGGVLGMGHDVDLSQYDAMAASLAAGNPNNTINVGDVHIKNEHGTNPNRKPGSQLHKPSGNDGSNSASMYSATPRPPLPVHIKKERMDGGISVGGVLGVSVSGIGSSNTAGSTSMHSMPISIKLPPPPPNGQGYIGAYSPESRRQLIERFNEKKKHRVWTKKVKYDVRKNFADSRLRIKGRFVKKEDEEIMRVLLT